MQKSKAKFDKSYNVHDFFLYKFISQVSMLHYSYRKYEKLLWHYAYEEQITGEISKENIKNTISCIKGTERWTYRNVYIYIFM